MNKLAYMTAAMAALLFSACSSDGEEAASQEQTAAVTVALSLPDGMSSRAENGDGTKANDLYYTLYDVNKSAVTAYTGVKETNFFTNGSLQNTLTLQLVVGKTYYLAFWAQNADAPYTFDWSNATVSMNYEDGTPANAEARDAFFNWATVTMTGPETISVELYRPFAQVNIGTNDYNAAVAAGTTVTKTAIEITADTYATLNLLTGAASDPVAVKFGQTAMPTDDKGFPTQEDANAKAPDTGWTWLSMNYLLMNAVDATNSGGNEVIGKITLSTDQTEDKEYANIPVKRNYRTNIMGTLLTATAEFIVEIKPDFDTPDFDEVQ
ncbi:MAG: hypothetical protein LUD17_07165 [Bacteroidales bacterium]|nr:hypothetical protein [Bacteroidales bacterium]